MTLLAALIVTVVTFLFSVTMILLIVGPVLLLKPRRRTAEYYKALGQPVSPSELGLTFEEITVAGKDQLNISSWLVKSEMPARGTIIYLHGVGDCKMDGIRFAKFMHDNRFNVFLFDSRRHGESGGEFCTYGFFEKYDLEKIIDYLLSRNDISIGKIGLFGTSMGAAVALQTAALDKRISAVIAENSFATLRSIFDDYQKRMVKLPFHYLRNLVIKRSEIMAGFIANEVSPLEALQQINIPKLIIYGTEDHLIKCQYSQKLYDTALEPKELFAIEGASHNDTWNTAGSLYEQRVLTFFEKSLS